MVADGYKSFAAAKLILFFDITKFFGKKMQFWDVFCRRMRDSIPRKRRKCRLTVGTTAKKTRGYSREHLTANGVLL